MAKKEEKEDMEMKWHELRRDRDDNCNVTVHKSYSGYLDIGAVFQRFKLNISSTTF